MTYLAKSGLLDEDRGFIGLKLLPWHVNWLYTLVIIDGCDIGATACLCTLIDHILRQDIINTELAAQLDLMSSYLATFTNFF